MAAPTPVSAYLHSATMVKPGVFLLARLWPVLSGTEPWFWLVGGAGAFTLLLGAYVAMFQSDLKALLAYSTISHLGLITLLLGLNSPLAAVAAVFHIMNHATFKASLFMAAGIIDHETGTRDIRRLSGLFKLMPITGTLAIVASAAMAGVPLLNGFLSKEMFFAETVFIESHAVGRMRPAGRRDARRHLQRRLFAALRVRRLLRPALRPRPAEARRTSRRTGCACRSSCWCWPAWWSASRRRGRSAPCSPRPRAPVVGGALPAYSLALWHGFNLPLLMSLVALAGGVVLYLLQRRQRARGALDARRCCIASTASACSRTLLARLERGRPPRPAPAGHAAPAAAVAAAGRWSRWPAPARRSGSRRPRAASRELLPFSPMFAMPWLIGCACALAAAWQAKFHRLASLMLASGAGLVCCITFIWFSAPDLALTQLVVEVVTTVLFLLGLRWLPMRTAKPRARARRGCGPGAGAAATCCVADRRRRRHGARSPGR